MYHVGRPGEDGFTERVLASWGVDGHNSHTNVCSSGARAGYHFWMGIDPVDRCLPFAPQVSWRQSGPTARRA
jgi:hypothetical protein